MGKLSIAAQLAAIQRQKDLLEKKEAALKAESHRKVLTQIVKMAMDVGLSLSEISAAYEGHQTKPPSKTSANSLKSGSLKPHRMKGVKLPAKYRNPLDPNQTWTGRGVDPNWIVKLREAGALETALIKSE